MGKRGCRYYLLLSITEDAIEGTVGSPDAEQSQAEGPDEELGTQAVSGPVLHHRLKQNRLKKQTNTGLIPNFYRLF